MVKFHKKAPGLSLSNSCWQNLQPEKDVIASWILAVNHSVSNNKRCLGYTCKITRYLIHIKLSTWKVWNKFLTTLSISATIMSKVTEKKMLFWVHQLVNMKLGSPTFKVLWKIGDNNFVPGLLQKTVTSSRKTLAGSLFSKLQPWRTAFIRNTYQNICEHQLHCVQLEALVEVLLKWERD